MYSEAPAVPPDRLYCATLSLPATSYMVSPMHLFIALRRKHTFLELFLASLSQKGMFWGFFSTLMHMPFRWSSFSNPLLQSRSSKIFHFREWITLNNWRVKWKLTHCLQFSSDAEPEKYLWLKSSRSGPGMITGWSQARTGSQIGFSKVKEHKPFRFFSTNIQYVF